MNILYVCTWNIFRSMSAEYLTKKYIDDNAISNFFVSSAWTIAHIDLPFSMTVKRLAFYGCDPSHHIQRKITQEILAAQDIIICMAEHHRQSVNALWFEAVLFNEIAYNLTEDVLDDGEYMQINWPYLDIEEYVPTIIDYIHDAIPLIISSIVKK
jgi:protein-tyrosine-phosphatase